ncbi:MAG: starch-binding protein [Ruminococcus sp.]
MLAKRNLKKAVSVIMAICLILSCGIVSALAVSAATATTVYFYNGDNWSDVYAYQYSTTGLASETTGAWPGTQATAEGNGWYSVSIPLAANGNDSCFNVIFNNNGGDNNKQYEATIIDDVNVYMTTENNKTFSSKEAALGQPVKPSEPADGTTRVHFYNADNWSEVYAYEWSTQFKGEALGAWPGTKATDEGDGWFYVDVPLVPEGNDACFNVIFNNNGGDSNKQYEATIIDDVNVYMTTENNKTYSSKEAALGQPVKPSEPADGSTRVYFYNAENWEKVYAYQYSQTSLATETLGAWPGVEATAEGDGWFFVDVPLIANGSDACFSIIFNSYQGVDTIQYQAPILDTVNVYMINKNDVTFDSKEAALRGENPTDPKPTDPSPSTPVEAMVGDADGNGIVNVKDATAVQKHAANIITLVGQLFENADFNSDGAVNVKDATGIQKQVAGII